MPFQVVGSGESLSANITLKSILAVMAPQMKLSGGFHWEALATELTKMSFLGRRRCLRLSSHRLPPEFSAAESSETVANRDERRLENIQYLCPTGVTPELSQLLNISFTASCISRAATARSSGSLDSA